MVVTSFLLQAALFVFLVINADRLACRLGYGHLVGLIAGVLAWVFVIAMFAGMLFIKDRVARRQAADP